ncbi:alpha/beta hydrolase [Gellertiella hungarica]|uniref:Acetyl esterase/lipase n=1 Tax=Gellertiella hungarica TaxID=1572859 RepID=A0A7W6NI31_9HYPH|nr:alpha/beta hydrolase [Gellertiella hungarica]MBB4062945.1 acetyl esterase/lipase [Gellertiella hungarica]
MFGQRVSDFEVAYQNGAHIAGSERWPDAWDRPAARFRAALQEKGRAELDIAYGDNPRHRYDLFLPEAKPKGLAVFVHGGYWMAFDKSTWSHLAAGALAHGFAVAMPSYRLAPEATIAEIARDVGAAISAAAGRIGGPIHLAGHSAGGHLVTRMACMDAPLPATVQARIAHVLSLSGVHDLRPIIRTDMRPTLRLDEETARAESPALLRPVDGTRLTCWAGGAERAEFRRQNALLANIWIGLGATTFAWEEPDRHHFDVIDDLADPASLLVRTWIG